MQFLREVLKFTSATVRRFNVTCRTNLSKKVWDAKIAWKLRYDIVIIKFKNDVIIPNSVIYCIILLSKVVDSIFNLCSCRAKD